MSQYLYRPNNYVNLNYEDEPILNQEDEDESILNQEDEDESILNQDDDLLTAYGPAQGEYEDTVSNIQSNLTSGLSRINAETDKLMENYGNYLRGQDGIEVNPQKASFGVDTETLAQLIDSNKPRVSDSAYIAALAQAGAQMGSIGGKVADTSALQNYAKADMQERKIAADRKQKMRAIARRIQDKRKKDRDNLETKLFKVGFGRQKLKRDALKDKARADMMDAKNQLLTDQKIVKDNLRLKKENDQLEKKAKKIKDDNLKAANKAGGDKSKYIQPFSRRNQPWKTESQQIAAKVTGAETKKQIRLATMKFLATAKMIELIVNEKGIASGLEAFKRKIDITDAEWEVVRSQWKEATSKGLTGAASTEREIEIYSSWLPGGSITGSLPKNMVNLTLKAYNQARNELLSHNIHPEKYLIETQLENNKLTPYTQYPDGQDRYDKILKGKKEYLIDRGLRESVSRNYHYYEENDLLNEHPYMEKFFKRLPSVKNESYIIPKNKLKSDLDGNPYIRIVPRKINNDPKSTVDTNLDDFYDSEKL